MDYKSEAKYLKISPRKLREVVDVVNKQPLEKILANLEFIDKKGAKILLEALNSAIANVKNKTDISLARLKIKSLEINQGPKLKRWRPASRGMAHPYSKYRSHIKIILTDNFKVKSSKF